MKKKSLILIPVFVWLLVGIYGIFYNITYIDEAKYLIKGWLITTGQISYYSTPEFFYQHMPGIFLWYGLGQKIFGQSLLIARLQSFLMGLGVLWFSYKSTGKKILPILALAPVAILYYSAAVPQSIIALGLILAFYFLQKKRYLLTTLAFSLCFIIRENFLFSLIIYTLFLIIELRKNLKELLINLLLEGIVLGIFFIPGWPGILNVLKNFPGVSLLLPISPAEKTVLGLNWMQVNFSWQEYWLAIREFGAIYFCFLLVGLRAIIQGIKNKSLWKKDNHWRLLLVITGFNFMAHAWSASQLSPRAIIPYLAYSFPLLAIIISRLLPEKIKGYYWLLGLALLSLPLTSLFHWPNRINTIKQLTFSAQALKPVIVDKKKIVWLTEPMSLYLAGRVSYYPLINHTNFYKDSPDTDTVRQLGFWNQTMMIEWLESADLIVIDENRFILLNTNPKAAALPLMMRSKLAQKYQEIPASHNIWLGNLMFYFPKISTTR